MKSLLPLDNLFDKDLFSIGSATLNVSTVIGIVVILVCTWIALYLIKKGIYRIHKLDKGKKYSINTLIKYMVWIISISLILNVLGYKLSALILGSAALLVGLGMGLRNIFSNFVSGLVLLIDNTIKVGDVIEVNQLVCEVREINLRTTLVMTREDKCILLPNSELTNHKLINWTHIHQTARFDVSVHTEYGIDIIKIEEIMLAVAQTHDKVHRFPAPFVRLNEYADRGLVFTLYFWSDNLFRIENTKSDLRKQIYIELTKAGIKIPYPNYNIHTHLNAENTPHSSSC